MTAENKINLTHELQKRKNAVATAILGMQVQGKMLEYYLVRLEHDDDMLGARYVDADRRKYIYGELTAPITEAYDRYSDLYRIQGFGGEQIPFKAFEDYVLVKINQKILDPARTGLGVSVKPEEIKSELGRLSDARIGEMLLAVCGEKTNFNSAQFAPVQKAMLERLEKNGIDAAKLKHLRLELFRVVVEMRRKLEKPVERISWREIYDSLVEELERTAPSRIKVLTYPPGITPGKIKKK
jgi:hypothetical protein